MDPFLSMPLFDDVLQEQSPSSAFTTPLTDDVLSRAVSPLMTPDHDGGAMTETQYKAIYDLQASGSSSSIPSDASGLSLSSDELAAAQAIAQGNPDPFLATRQATSYHMLQPMSRGKVAATTTSSAKGRPDIPNPFLANHQAITPSYHVLQPMVRGQVAATATSSAQGSPALPDPFLATRRVLQPIQNHPFRPIAPAAPGSAESGPSPSHRCVPVLVNDLR